MFAGPLDAVAFTLLEEDVEVDSSMQAYCWCHGLYLASRREAAETGKASYLSAVVWNVAVAPPAKIKRIQYWLQSTRGLITLMYLSAFQTGL